MPISSVNFQMLYEMENFINNFFWQQKLNINVIFGFSWRRHLLRDIVIEWVYPFPPGYFWYTEKEAALKFKGMQVSYLDQKGSSVFNII